MSGIKISHPRIIWFVHPFITRLTRLIFLTLALFMLAAVNPVQAQTVQPDALVILMQGDLYTWTPGNAGVTQVTTWKYNRKPIPAGSGDYTAYTSTARVAVDALVNTLPGSFFGSPPANIWVMTKGTSETATFTRVVDQPPGVVFNPTATSTAVIRSDASWSPDGTMLAWTEAILPDYTGRLVGYNRLSGEQFEISTSLPPTFQDAGYYAYPPLWCDLGVALMGTTINANADGSAAFVQSLTIYQPTSPTTFIQLPPLVINDRTSIAAVDNSALPAADGLSMVDTVCLPNGIGILYNDGKIRVVQANSQGVPALVLTVPAIRATNATGIGYTLRLQTIGEYPGLSWQWLLETSNGVIAIDGLNTVDNGAYNVPFAARTAISPDGNTVAYISSDGVYATVNGAWIKIPGTEKADANSALAWSELRWK